MLFGDKNLRQTVNNFTHIHTSYYNATSASAVSTWEILFTKEFSITWRNGRTYECNIVCVLKLFAWYECETKCVLFQRRRCWVFGTHTPRDAPTECVLLNELSLLPSYSLCVCTKNEVDDCWLWDLHNIHSSIQPRFLTPRVVFII